MDRRAGRDRRGGRASQDIRADTERNESGAWPVEAFDLLLGRMDILQQQIGDLGTRLAAVEEHLAHPRPASA